MECASPAQHNSRRHPLNVIPNPRLKQFPRPRPNSEPKRRLRNRGAPCLASFARRGIPRPHPSEDLESSTTGKGTTSILEPALSKRSAPKGAAKGKPTPRHVSPGGAADKRPRYFHPQPRRHHHEIKLRPLSPLLAPLQLPPASISGQKTRRGCPMSRVFWETWDSTDDSFFSERN